MIYKKTIGLAAVTSFALAVSPYITNPASAQQIPPQFLPPPYTQTDPYPPPAPGTTLPPQGGCTGPFCPGGTSFGYGYAPSGHARAGKAGPPSAQSGKAMARGRQTYGRTPYSSRPSTSRMIESSKRQGR